MAKNDFYAKSRREIDLRGELYNTMYGSGQEIPKSQKGLLRKFRRNNDGSKIRCPCVDLVTDEPNKDSLCRYCRGEKYLWDEEPVDFYLTEVQTESQLADRETLRQPGLMITQFYVIYIPASFSLTEGDKIVRLELDKEGVPIVPNRRRDIIRLSTLRDMRLDYARLEYWKANGFAESSRYL